MTRHYAKNKTGIGHFCNQNNKQDVLCGVTVKQINIWKGCNNGQHNTNCIGIQRQQLIILECGDTATMKNNKDRITSRKYIKQVNAYMFTMWK